MQSFILSLVGVGLATPSIVWILFNKLIDSKLSRMLEKYKTQLLIQAAEHDVRFRELHVKRAEALVELHVMLQDLFLALERYTELLESSSEPNKSDKFSRVAEINDELNHLFNHKRIFLSHKMDHDIEAFLFAIRRTARDMRHALADSSTGLDWDDVYDRVQNDIKPVLKSLRSEFRNLLGVEKIEAPE